MTPAFAEELHYFNGVTLKGEEKLSNLTLSSYSSTKASAEETNIAQKWYQAYCLSQIETIIRHSAYGLKHEDLSP